MRSEYKSLIDFVDLTENPGQDAFLGASELVPPAPLHEGALKEPRVTEQIWMVFDTSTLSASGLTKLPSGALPPISASSHSKFFQFHSFFEGDFLHPHHISIEAIEGALLKEQQIRNQLELELARERKLRQNIEARLSALEERVASIMSKSSPKEDEDQRNKAADAQRLGGTVSAPPSHWMIPPRLRLADPSQAKKFPMVVTLADDDDDDDDDGDIGNEPDTL